MSADKAPNRNNVLQLRRPLQADVPQHTVQAQVLPAWSFGSYNIPGIIARLNSTPKRRAVISLLILMFGLYTFGFSLLFHSKLLLAQALGGAILPEIGPNHRVVFFGIERLRTQHKAAFFFALTGIAAALFYPINPTLSIVLICPAIFAANRFLWHWLAPGARRFVMIAENSRADRIYDKVLIIGGSTFNHTPDLLLTPPDIIDVCFRCTTFQRIIGISRIEIAFRIAGEIEKTSINSVRDPTMSKRVASYIATEFRSGLIIQRRAA